MPELPSKRRIAARRMIYATTTTAGAVPVAATAAKPSWSVTGIATGHATTVENDALFGVILIVSRLRSATKLRLSCREVPMRSHVGRFTLLTTCLVIAFFSFTPVSAQSGDVPFFESSPAKATGTFYKNTIIYPHFTKYSHVKELSRDSTIIVLAVVESSSSRLLPSRRKFVVTDYQIAIRSSLKGSLKRGDNVTITMPGGSVQVDNQHSRELTRPQFWKDPEIGTTYVFFLVPYSNSSFALTGGPQGMFAISANKRIVPQGLKQDSLTRANRNKELKLFLQELKEVVKAHLKPDGSI